MRNQTAVHKTCFMCGALRVGEYTDHAARPDTEIIRRLSLFMQDDWKACCTFLLCVAIKERSVCVETRQNLLCEEAIKEARQQAAKRFPELLGIL